MIPAHYLIAYAKMMRSSVVLVVSAEIEADRLWQHLMTKPLFRQASVNAIDTACRWWFDSGYIEHVQAREAAG